jgi:SAM-dependent methyltransferase
MVGDGWISSPPSTDKQGLPQRWLNRWRRIGQEPMGLTAALQPTARSLAPTGKEECHLSPGFREIVSHLNQDRSLAVLDLGPSMSATVAFFSRYHCYLQIADLLASLPRDPSHAAIARHLPEGNARFDLVLAWDTFDHLERSTAQVLVAQLARLCRPGAWLLAHVATSIEHPLPPTTFAVLDQETLLYRPRPGQPGKRLIFSPAAIETLLKGFRIEHSYVLRHQVHEWVAVREGASVPLDTTLSTATR